MNKTPDTGTRLRNAVNSVAVPADLEARIRGQIHGGELLPEERARLKSAVENMPIPPFLDARIRNRLRETRVRRGWFPVLIPAGVAAALLVALSLAYQFGHLRLTTGAQESYIASVSTHIATMMRVGLGDHIHCSVFRKYPKNLPTAEQFVEKMGSEYAGLIPIVRSQVPETYRMSLAHKCRYHGRSFVHLSLMNDTNMLSLVMTRKGEGESFGANDMLPALVQAGIPMYQASAQRFQISAFETRDYMVYFISDLSKQRNTDLMLALAPRVNDFLSKSAL